MGEGVDLALNLLEQRKAAYKATGVDYYQPILVLMSDGVYNALTDQELALAMEQPPEEAAQAIGRAIEEKHYQNQDNYTAVILGCEGPPPAQKQPKEGKHR